MVKKSNIHIYMPSTYFRGLSLCRDYIKIFISKKNIQRKKKNTKEKKSFSTEVMAKTAQGI